MNFFKRLQVLLTSKFYQFLTSNSMKNFESDAGMNIL